MKVIKRLLKNVHLGFWDTDMSPLPLEGIQVLDCTQVMAGPFCTMLLADMGAEVIKVEKPEGDDSRRMGPPFIGDESAAFLALNRNKKSIVLDFKNDNDLNKIFKVDCHIILLNIVSNRIPRTLYSYFKLNHYL